MKLPLILLILTIIPITHAELEFIEGQSECINYHILDTTGNNVQDATLTVVVLQNNTQVETGTATHTRTGIYCYNTTGNWTPGPYAAHVNVSFTDGNVSAGVTQIQVIQPTNRNIAVSILLTITGILIYYFLHRKYKYLGGIGYIILGMGVLLAYTGDIQKLLASIIIGIGIFLTVIDMSQIQYHRHSRT